MTQAQMESGESKGASILLLGEGDFSFSYDLVRFLLFHSSQIEGEAKTTGDVGSRTFLRVNQIVATGIDTGGEVAEKYKDSSFIIQKLKSLNHKTGKEKRDFTVAVRHGVNAILPLTADDGCDDTTGVESPNPATLVIFNHPHLGVENARRHSQFLSHLFYSVRNGWMKQEGRLYLTLAIGQWERWGGQVAAQRSGLFLLDRCPFRPPYLEQQQLRPYYQQRRHQTGKSFAGRAMGSETFTLSSAAATTENHQSLRIINKPFWLSSDENKQPPRKKEAKRNFVCRHCNKPFAEERSLKNHMRSKHSEGSVLKRKLDYPSCPQCSRVFESSAALRDHIRATHSALHEKIQRNCNEELATRGEFDQESSYSCKICHASFATLEEKAEHLELFVPTVTNSTEPLQLQCAFCSKAFREKRAKLQHENFCQSKTTSNSPEAVDIVCVPSPSDID